MWAARKREFQLDLAETRECLAKEKDPVMRAILQSDIEHDERIITFISGIVPD